MSLKFVRQHAQATMARTNAQHPYEEPHRKPEAEKMCRQRHTCCTCNAVSSDLLRGEALSRPRRWPPRKQCLVFGNAAARPTVAAQPLPADVLTPQLGGPKQLGRLLVRTEEDEAADGDPGHARRNALEEGRDALLLRDGREGLDSACVLLRLAVHGLLQHDARLGHIEGRSDRACDGTCDRAAGRTLDRVSLLALPCRDPVLERLVDRELDEGEWDLTCNRRAVARVEGSKATLPHGSA
mmetsp:Transcript_58069/g.79720  ORF Transcript_58069/g.79720 Transcript_58069/m.79720 type:complete len:240 (-) Transcript_58069:134-853(-)